AALSWDGLHASVNDITALTQTTLAQTARGFVYTADSSGGAIHGYERTGDGGLVSRVTLSGGALDYRGRVIDLDTVAVAGQSYLLATDSAGRGVSSYRIDPTTGALEVRGLMGAVQGLGVMEPTALETVTIGGATYAVLASAGTGSGALSVLRIHSDGHL
ncbi:lactonase family protein, partial [Rhodobacteraceae bacterium 10Alg 79]|nr:lactonase family protein [Rhodoalgimonas zhirmunskyi]